MNSETWTPPKLITWIKTELEKRNLGGNCRLEAELLVAAGLKSNRLDLYLQFDRPVTIEERTQVRTLVRRRLDREPLAYILGDAHFWTLTLQVGPGVLIPRSDTEVLIEYLTQVIAPTSHLKALEFGIGSGAISLAWALETSGLEIDGLEISPQAFDWAQKNLEAYQEQITQNKSTVHWHLGKSLTDFSGPYDIIVSNPPYITKAEMAALQPEVKSFEPSVALEGGEDGLVFYRLLLQEGLRLLKPKGILVVEHGYAQKEAILALMPEGYHLTAARQDLSHQDRMLVFERQPSN